MKVVLNFWQFENDFIKAIFISETFLIDNEKK